MINVKQLKQGSYGLINEQKNKQKMNMIYNQLPVNYILLTWGKYMYIQNVAVLNIFVGTKHNPPPHQSEHIQQI